MKIYRKERKIVNGGELIKVSYKFYGGKHSFSFIACLTLLPCCSRIVFYYTRKQTRAKSTNYCHELAVKSIIILFISTVEGNVL